MAELRIDFRERAKRPLVWAMLLSIALHAFAGSVLFHGWERHNDTLPQPINVTLDSLPPQPAPVELPKLVYGGTQAD